MRTELLQSHAITDKQLALLIEQAREVDALRLRQLERDGIGWDSTLNKFVVVKPEATDGHTV